MHMHKCLNKRAKGETLKQFWLMCVVAVLLMGIVAAENAEDCYSKCKLESYTDCVNAGTSSEECYKTAYVPCADSCPKPEVRPVERVDVPQAVAAVRAVPVRVAVPVAPAAECQEKCKGVYESCTQSGGSLEDCKKKYSDCFSACAPQPAAPERKPIEVPQPSACPAIAETPCELCVNSYRACIKKGVAEAEQEQEGRVHCSEGIVTCLDNCISGIAPRPTEKAVPPNIRTVPPITPIEIPEEKTAQAPVPAAAPTLPAPNEKTEREEKQAPKPEEPPVQSATTPAQPATPSPPAPALWSRIKQWLFG